MLETLDYAKPATPPRRSWFTAVSMATFIIAWVARYLIYQTYDGQYTPDFAWERTWGMAVDVGMFFIFLAGIAFGVVAHRRSDRKDHPQIVIVLNGLSLLLIVLALTH